MKKTHSWSTDSGNQKVIDNENTIDTRKKSKLNCKKVTIIIFSIIGSILILTLIIRYHTQPMFLFIQNDIGDSNNNDQNNPQKYQEFINHQYHHVMHPIWDLLYKDLLTSPLNRMTISVPINDNTTRSYQVLAIETSKIDNLDKMVPKYDNQVTLYLSLGHKLIIKNSHVEVFDEGSNLIQSFENDPNIKTSSEQIFDNSSNNYYPKNERFLQNNIYDSQLRRVDFKNQVNNHEIDRLFREQGYYNYTTTKNWTYNPEIIYPVIPTYYPRNPYVAPYGNPYYYAPNILVPYIYVY
ncbi:uncharacterized protein CMU_011590 [Cryptosporidium muris RN66]|uniref:Transmembrane protein n=1 Tax=Cryptosporidium muris (strain RN66) TaxID=441375 RepID=B6AJ18_CRYMR|nr:uncharacterized protein CMU_011590 [Cryptosporidium muris RN66]EEA08209.1 hypothetical protein, conserved [Cryptosporidium muris RN66]|eukprot:XP_002142558.1 hypothetical protein [Cryptosporidium muris RN66]